MRGVHVDDDLMARSIASRNTTEIRRKNLSSLGAGHLGRGGEAQYVSGFALDREARSQPRFTVAGGPGVPYGMGGDTRPVHTDAVSSSPIARLWLLRGRDESSCGSGHSPATMWLTELVVSF